MVFMFRIGQTGSAVAPGMRRLKVSNRLLAALRD